MQYKCITKYPQIEFTFTNILQVILIKKSEDLLRIPRKKKGAVHLFSAFLFLAGGFIFGQGEEAVINLGSQGSGKISKFYFS